MFKVADLSGWAQAGIAVVSAAAGTVFWTGVTSTRLHQTEQQVQALEQRQSADHDKVVTQDQKLDDIKSAVSEIKGDVKDLLKQQAK